MSKSVRNCLTTITTLFCLTVSLAGCGGGGGSAQSGGVVDPAPAFKGSTAKAVPTEANAEELAKGGFDGVDFATSIRVAKTSGSSAATASDNRPVFQAVQVLKQSVRRMALPRKAAQLRKAEPSAAKASKSVGRTNSFQLEGDSGGTASYTLEINDTTGSFFGTIVFRGFTSNGLVIDGITETLGTFDANQQEFSRLTLSFKTLTMRSTNFTIVLSGALSWGFNFAASTETLSMNMVLLEQASAKTYWFNNYEIVTVYGGSSLTRTISGRYYDHDHGYVDLTTRTQLAVRYSDQLPSQGCLAFSGTAGRWIRLNFLATSLVIEVDTNGDDAAEWQVERPTNVLPPENTAPTAAAGPDQSVSQWATVSLDGSASSDREGDPLSYNWTIVSSPGYTPLTGANTATPSFNATLVGTYVLSLTVYDGNAFSPPDTVTVVVTTPTASDPAFVAQQWQYGIYGTSIGQAGLFTTDLDGDGTPEIIACGSTGGGSYINMWYVVRKAESDYEQVWRSPLYGVTIVSMLLADMNADGKDDVVVVLADGAVRIYNGPTLQEIRRLQFAASLKDLAVADLDGDGNKEVITSDGIGVSVYSAQTGALQWRIASGGGSSIAVGNVDTDQAQEIVTTNYGGKGYVLNGLSGAIKWEYVNSFGARVKLADLDGDGLQEIIGAAPWYKITIFDADQKSPTWEIATSQHIGAFTVADTDGDGIPEIIYGDGYWGKVHAVDVRTRTKRWSVTNTVCGVSGIATGDVDKDGTQELLWGGGGDSSGADYLYIAVPLTGAIKWQSKDVSGLKALAVGDVDNDGIDELVMVTESSNSGYDGGIIHVFNARTHVLKYQVDLGTMDWMGSNRAVLIGDVDGDGRNELVLTATNLYDSFISIYDGATGTLKRQSAGDSSGFYSALAIGDVDNDGRTEIVAVKGGTFSISSGVNLVVFAGDTLQEKWRSVDLGVYGAPLYNLKLADLDKDGHPDIIATMPDSRLLVFDGVSHILKLMLDTPVRAIEIADLDADGFSEILVGRNDGYIDVYDGVTFAVRKSVYTFGTTPVDVLRFADLNGDGSKEWLVASNGVLSILDGQGLKWRSAYLGNNLGRGNIIAVRDVNGNGRQDVFIGADPALYQFE